MEIRDIGDTRYWSYEILEIRDIGDTRYWIYEILEIRDIGEVPERKGLVLVLLAGSSIIFIKFFVQLVSFRL